MADKLSPEEVEKYLARIHYTGPREPTIEVLSELQRCHLLSVPFENLSVYGKEKIFLTKDWLFDKIVRRQRGGFCYELNTMFSFLLDYFGFNFKTYGAQVFSSSTGRFGPRFDHMILVVNSTEHKLWLTDVGFGDAFWTPLLLTDPAEELKQHSGMYRIRKDGENFFYEEKRKVTVDNYGQGELAKEHSQGVPTWVTQYQFDLVPAATQDFNNMLEYHQTNVDSSFTHDRVCTVARPWGRVTVGNNKLVTTTYLGKNKVRKESRKLVGEEEVVKEVEEKFGIKRECCFYPEGSMFYGVESNN